MEGPSTELSTIALILSIVAMVEQSFYIINQQILIIRLRHFKL